MIPDPMEKMLIFRKLTQDNLSLARMQALPDRCRNGGYLCHLISCLIFLGATEYILNHDIPTFRTLVREAANNFRELFLRSDAGQLGYWTYTMPSILTLRVLTTTLAVGEISLTRELALLMSGREDIDPLETFPIFVSMDLCFRGALLRTLEAQPKEVRKLVRQTGWKKYNGLRGYGTIVQAIVNHDAAMATEGLKDIEEGISKGWETHAVIYDSPTDRFLCTWGLGMANLARLRGLDVPAIPPLIPEDLLIPLKEEAGHDQD